MRSPERALPTLRMRVLAAALLVAFVGLGVRAAYLTVYDTRGARRGDVQMGGSVRIQAARGLIVDRDGAALALAVPAPSVYAEPPRLADAALAARRLAGVLDADASRLRARLRRRAPFVFLARWVSEEQAQAVEALGLPGVHVLREPRRVYPHGPVAGHVLGFANIDGRGVRGIEQQEDAWLRGRPRRVPVERDARRRALASGSLDVRSAAGGDIALTLDAGLQAEVHAALLQAVSEHRARGGMAISLDPRSGEIRALAEVPEFDPNRFRHVPYAQTRARGLLDALEPGSSLKPFVVAAALEHGVLEPDQAIDCEGGSYRVPGKTLRDLKPHETLDAAGVLRVSSNIGAVKIAERLGRERHFGMLRAFGFGAATGSGFPEESAGLLRPWRRWQPVDHATIAFGQGIAVTPLQLAAALAALADGGTWRTPRLVAARRRPGEPWQPVPPGPSRQVVRPEVAARVLAMLEGVVAEDGGTGGRAALRSVRVAGKTGTAQKLDPETGAYSTNRYLAWFAGVAPADDPRLVSVVVLDEPAGELHTGGAVAAPVFAKVATAQLARAGISTEPMQRRPRPPRQPAPEPVVASAPSPERPVAPATAVSTGPPASPEAAAEPIVQLGDRLLLPDFRGLTPEEVKSLTAGASLAVELQGDGRAVAQEPEPGAIVSARGSRIRVRFARGEEG